MEIVRCFFCGREFEITDEVQLMINASQDFIDKAAGETSCNFMNFGTFYFLRRQPVFLCDECEELKRDVYFPKE